MKLYECDCAVRAERLIERWMHVGDLFEQNDTIFINKVAIVVVCQVHRFRYTSATV